MQDFLSFSVGELGSILADTVVVDRSTNEVVFFSAISYNTLINVSIKELNKNNSIYCSNVGYVRTAKQGYEIETKKQSENDYTHMVGYAKNKIVYKEDGSEDIRLYIFCKDKSELSNKIFNLASKYSSIPILEEWKDYLTESLMDAFRINELTVRTKYDEIPFKAYCVFFDKKCIKTIIQEGLQTQEINIKGSNNPSAVMSNIKGLNDYLNSFGETLAEKIQTAFKPKFVPGEDKYDTYATYIDDYIYKNAGIELFEAQKSVVQAVVNDLKVNDSTFLIAEMGSGKTTMGAMIPYIHNANKNKGYNTIVSCPSHLTNVWKREIEERIPNARAYIIQDYHDLIALEPKLRNSCKIENSYIILSKERAKLGYDIRPAAIWNNVKKTFVCPECGQVLYTKEYEGTGRNKTPIKVNFNAFSMTKKLAHNTRCMNTIKKWDDKEKKYKRVPCNASLWQPLNRNDESHKWYKLGSEGWVLKQHIIPITTNLMNKEKLSKKESALLKKIIEPYEMMKIGEEPVSSYKGNRRYPIAKYIRERMNDVFDYCLVDECHQAKGLTEQGEAIADLIRSSKKSVLLTGTLLNGYADGLYYLLWRTVPKLMKKEGFSFKDEGEFARLYGVLSRESRFQMQNGRRGRRVGSVKEKRLPGVSPLVFTKFLLEHAVFLSLSDMSNGLPNYEEIPVAVSMDTELFNSYQQFEIAFREYATSNPKSMSKKALGSFLQNLTVYPDCPHITSPIINPDNGAVIYTPTQLPKQRSNKEEELLRLVKERLANGEKVMVYYSWVNKTDIGNSLLEMFAENDIKAFELKSNVAPDKREEWVEKHLEKGMQVMICNPKLVETGLTLLDFTSIIFYQMGYNLFTMRQASRRSWRLSQKKDVKVYFMYYQMSIQEQIISLMATKLQAAMALEGKFSEEGLRAMSNNEDLLTQIANNVVEGIKDTVNKEIFKASTFIKATEHVVRKHNTPISMLVSKLDDLGNKTLFDNAKLKAIPKRKIIKLNDNLLNNPINLFC